MFAPGFVTLFFVALFAAVNVAGYPVPLPIRRALAQRGPAPFEPIQAYINRDLHDTLIYKKRDTNTIPEETPTKAPNSVLQLYGKRQIPEEVPTKAPDGDVVPYAKRQIPEEVPTKAPNGDTVPYAKRQIPEEVPTKAPNGDIVPYAKRQIPEEVPTKAPNGDIVPY